MTTQYRTMYRRSLGSQRYPSIFSVSVLACGAVAGPFHFINEQVFILKTVTDHARLRACDALENKVISLM